MYFKMTRSIVLIAFAFLTTQILAERIYNQKSPSLVITTTQAPKQAPDSECSRNAPGLSLVNLGVGSYFFSNDTTKLNWNDAQEFCRSNRLELASIENYAENIAIVTHLLTIRLTNYLDGTWISGQKNTNGSWTWSGTGKPIEYSNWYDNHPLPREDKDRVAISGFRTKVRWISLGKSEAKRFLCECPVATKAA